MKNSKEIDVDWEVRDCYLSSYARSVVRRLLRTEDGLKNISIENICKKIGKDSLVLENLDKLPKTSDYISSILQSVVSGKDVDNFVGFS